MNRQYYQLTKANNAATINIYGDITSYPCSDSDVSANNLSQMLDSLGDVNEIAVYINSYGGEVAEGLAIYNALKRHKAKVTTYCDGFACSIASVIFVAGDERIMNDSSLLMIHNAWSLAMGNAKELRKQADDLDKITQASITAYKAHSTLSEDEIVEMMDNETWILPEEAIEHGFATAIETNDSEKTSQNAKRNLLELVKMARKASEEEAEEEPADPEDEEEPTEPETEDESEQDEPEVEDGEDSEEEEEPEEESEEDEEQEKAAQRWSGFFNAFLQLERRNEK